MDGGASKNDNKEAQVRIRLEIIKLMQEANLKLDYHNKTELFNDVLMTSTIMKKDADNEYQQFLDDQEGKNEVESELNNDNCFFNSKLSKRELALYSSFSILYLLKHSRDMLVDLGRIWNCIQKSGLSMDRNSLNAKMHRYKSPSTSETASKRSRKYVDWKDNDPSDRWITDDGKQELERLTKMIKPEVRAHLIAVADES